MELLEWANTGGRKHPELEVIETGFIPSYTWKDLNGRGNRKVPAAYFVVKNKEKGSKHVVVVAVDPFESFLRFAAWCGDKELKNELGLTDRCIFWKKRTCKHVEHVTACIRDELTKGLHPEIRETLTDFAEAVARYSSASQPFSSRECEVKEILKLGFPALIYGPTGSGKTYTVLKVLIEKQKAGELEFTVINFSSGIEDVDLLGKYIPLSGGWKIRDGELWKAFKEAQRSERKYVVVLEEISRASPKALNLLLKALDGVGKNYRLQNFLTGEELVVPKDKLLFIATANLGTGYSAEELDPSLMRRFLITRFWDYDLETEENLLKRLGLGVEESRRIMKFVHSQRDAYKQGEFPYPLDTGTLCKWVKVKTSTGMGWWTAFEFTTLYKIVSKNSLGYPDESQVKELKDMMRLLGLEG
jgi:MoxR-like ATPase